MRAWKNKLERLRNWAEKNQHLLGLTRTAIAVLIIATTLITAIIAYMVPAFGSALESMITWILAKAGSIVGPAAAFIGEHQELALLMAVAVIALLLHLRSLNLRLSSLEILLDKSVSANLANWDYHGQWSLDCDALSVTDSHHGGLSKTGASWEDYDFSFDFKIKSECGAWIVRAQSFDSYVMIQCNQDGRIRPHTRSLKGEEAAQFNVIEDYPHLASPAEWNKVKTEVRGYRIRVFLNERLVLDEANLLKEFPLGRVGFRCSGNEHALFKNIEVIQKMGRSI